MTSDVFSFGPVSKIWRSCWGEVSGEGRGSLGGVPFFFVNVFLHGGLFGEEIVLGARDVLTSFFLECS